MEHAMLHQNLYDIDLYARKSLDAMERGIDIIPDWIHHKIATARTHMKDVGHFVRYNAHMGRRYSGDDKHEMCRGALMNISEYARAISKSLEKGQKPLPEWAQHKLSVASEYMDCVGHYLEHRAKGRSYSGRDREQPFAYLIQAHGAQSGRRRARSYSGPAWQTQQYQKEYQGPRVYAQVEKVVYDSRGVAAVGGVRWVPPPASPGESYRGQRRYGAGPAWAGQAGVAQIPHPGGCIRGPRNKKGLKRGPAHAYGSLGYASMGDGSMDLATGGERMRRYAMTWRGYSITDCPGCDGPSAVVSEEEGAHFGADHALCPGCGGARHYGAGPAAPVGMAATTTQKGGCPEGMMKCYQFVKGGILGQLWYNCAKTEEQCSKNRISIGCQGSLKQACNCDPNTHSTGCIPAGAGAPTGMTTRPRKSSKKRGKKRRIRSRARRRAITARR